ncbi:collagen alpha-2(I) chain-like [Liolophura sinensis]|uniref:collagen alpha-2(I) chain-like n=1 Tax=Liolophura sinensis TaxID=3198878 RepID=UPI003158F56D
MYVSVAEVQAVEETGEERSDQGVSQDPGEEPSTAPSSSGEQQEEEVTGPESQEGIPDSDGSSPASQADRASSAGNAGQNRPRIQRIVWDDGSVHPAPAQAQSATHGSMIRPPPGRGRIGRGVHRGPRRMYPQRGRGAMRGFRSPQGRRGAF